VLYGSTNDNGLIDETGMPGAVDVADAPSQSSIHMLSDSTWAVNGSPAPLSCVPLPSP